MKKNTHSVFVALAILIGSFSFISVTQAQILRVNGMKVNSFGGKTVSVAGKNLKTSIRKVNDVLVNKASGGSVAPTALSQDPTCTPGTSDFVLRTDTLGSVTSYYEETKCMGLKWASASPYQTSTTWANSSTHCSNLGSEWRVPTSGELSAIVAYEKTSAPYTYLPDTVSANYWTSTTYAPSTSNAWVVYFSSGHVNSTSKTNSRQVVCVHD